MNDDDLRLALYALTRAMFCVDALCRAAKVLGISPAPYEEVLVELRTVERALER